MEDSTTEHDQPEGESSPHLGMGALIGIGAAFGLILGMLFDNLALGLAVGAGLGTVAGAVLETLRKG
jgi:uncharacterized membrane protein